MREGETASIDGRRRSFILRCGVIAAACAVLALDSSVLFLWTFHAIYPLPVIPLLFQVKFNGALEFFTGAIGLLAVLYGARRLAQGCGSFMIALSSATILEYLTGRNLGIDQAVFTDFYAAGQLYPGRIFRSACAAFLCMGISLLLAGGPKALRRIQLGAVEALAFLIFFLGCEGMLGHLLPGPLIQAWAAFVQVPLMASCGFMTLSIGLIGLAGRERAGRATLWFPGMVCTLVFVLDLGTPRGMVAGMAYIPLIFCSLWFSRPAMSFYFAALASALTTATYFLDAPGGITTWAVDVNQILVLCVLWITATLVYRGRISAQALRRSRTSEAALQTERDAGIALMASIVESSDDVILSKRLDGTILSWNHAAERIFGYTADEVIGRHIGLIIPEELRQEEETIVAEIAAGQSVSHFETVRVHKDGRRIPVSVTVSPIRDAEGKIVGASKVARDITARKALEDELRKSEARNTMALTGLSVGIWDWDIVTNRRYWSPRFKEMMGIEDETLAPTFEEFYSRLHPADREQTVFAINRHLEHRDPFSVEFRLRRSNGDYIWVDATGQATWDATGKPIRMVGAAGDITTRKTAERELGESRSRYKAVIDSTPDGLITTDSRGIVQSFNLSAERILGYRGSEVIGRDVQLLMHEPFISSRHTDVAHGLKAGEAHIVGVGREVSGIRKDGTQIPMDLTVSAFRVGNEPGFIGIIRDVTARKLVENDAALLLSSIVASSDDGIISESLSGFITSWNTSAEKMFGFTSRQAIGQTIRIIIPPEKRDEEEMILGRINRGEEVKHIETVRMGMNGERLSVSLTVSPVRDLTGRLIGASKILRDITQRKEEEAERLKAESMLRAIVDQAVDGLITIDSRGIVESYNPACCRIFGYASDEVIGRNIKMLMPEPYHSSHDGYISRYEASGEARIIGTLGREVTGQRKDGSVFSMDLSISALTLGTERHYSGLVRDNSERNRRELALRKSEDLLDRTGRLASVGGWELDLVTNKVNWSEETRRLLGVETGFTPTLEKGLNFYAPEARPIIAGAIEQALVDGKDWEVVVPMIQANGSKIWARVTATVQFEDGKPVRLVGALQDVSARVAEQEALSEANTRVALATESCGIGIWDWDLRSDRFICDKMVHKIFGLEPEGDKLFSLAYWAGRVHPNDRASVEQALQDCLNGVRPYNLDFRTVWDDGSVHHIKATGKLICNPNGVAARMVGTNMDITAGKLAEEELRNQADLLNLSHDSIMVRDFDGTIRFWNDGAQEMYGFSKADAIGSVSHDLLQTVFPRPLAEIEAELTRNKRWDGQLGHTTRDGVKVFVESRWVLQQIGGGTALRVLEINNDITERKNAEEASLRHVETLTRSNQELDAFAYAASHDLKAPLRVIQNASQWIEEDLEQHLTGESRENMDLLRSRVKRMDKLLDDLLQYSRIGRGTDKGQNEVISGAALMDNIRELLAPPPEFVVDMSSGFAGIEVYRMPLQQVLINLISNALKHHDKEAGRIEVGVEDLGSMFRFSVKDDGPGIPPQYHEQIFKMFQTLKPRDQVEGSGMGLAMVRKHIDIAGGTLHLESSVGHGSTFIFTWPKHVVGVKLADTEFATTGETR